MCDLLSFDYTDALSNNSSFELVSLCSVFFTDQSNGLDILGALFVKHDHAACQFCVTAWRKLAAALTQFCAAHDTRELKIFWDGRADWWPQFHFRLSLVPNKDHVSELEWKLTRYKAEAARWLHDKVRVLCVHIQAFHCAFHNHSCLEFGENLTDRKTLQSYKLNYFIKQRVIILIKSDTQTQYSTYR